MVRGCGAGLWTRSVPRIWRCAPEGATFLFWAPRALANRRRVGPARAGRNVKPRSSRFAHGPLPPPLSQVRSLVGERPNINPFCLTFAGEGLLSLRRRVGKCPLRTQRLRPLVLAAQWGTMGTPYADALHKRALNQCVKVKLVPRMREQIDESKWLCVTRKSKPESPASRLRKRAGGERRKVRPSRKAGWKFRSSATSQDLDGVLG